MRHSTYALALLALLAGPALAGAQGQQGTTPGQARMGRDAEDANLPLDRWQPKRLPTLPKGMTLDMIRAGDIVYRGRGGCVTCHGPDAFGMPNSGSGITMGLSFISNEWQAIDSLVTQGLPEPVTRSSVAMPGRGVGQNLTPEEVRQVSAYVWAISRVHGEPWPWGHATHRTGGDSTTAQRKP